MRRCASCGRLAFPPRLWCPDCGGDRWSDVEPPPGVVETETETRAGVRVGTVVVDGGPPVLARLAGGAGAGDRVVLDVADGVPVATRGTTGSAAA